jgi:hypothetical protein
MVGAREAFSISGGTPLLKLLIGQAPGAVRAAAKAAPGDSGGGAGVGAGVLATAAGGGGDGDGGRGGSGGTGARPARHRASGSLTTHPVNFADMLFFARDTRDTRDA